VLAALMLTSFLGCRATSGPGDGVRVSLRRVRLEERPQRRAIVSLEAAGITDSVSPHYFEIHSAADERGNALEVKFHSGYSASTGGVGGYVLTSNVPPHSFAVSIAPGASRIALLRGVVGHKVSESAKEIVVERPVKGRRFQAAQFVAEIADVGAWGYLIRFNAREDDEVGAEELRLRLSGAETVARDGTVRRARMVRAWGRGLLLREFDGESHSEIVGNGLEICFDEFDPSTVEALRFQFVDRVSYRQIPFELRDIPLP